LFYLRLTTIESAGEWNGLTRLGAAYCLVGDWASAAAILERAGSWSDASALDCLLLALAQHRLGRHDEARSECDGAIERLKTSTFDDETRDVALVALMEIQRLSIEEAESLLLDLAFPVDRFAHSAR
jgi:hypothetical protein